MYKKFKKISIGPATLVSAAFIGPGTVITCSIAGARFGTTLIWALIFGIITTIILQEMSSRLTLIRNNSLAGILKSDFKRKIFRIFVFFIVISAIGVGNSAYQSGNISGAAIGTELFLNKIGLTLSISQSTWLMGFVVFLLLFFGRYKILEKVLVGMVIIMSLVFILTIFLIKVDWYQFFINILFPVLPQHSIFITLGLIGTTVVPYNLFLHSSAILSRGWKKHDLAKSRMDTFISIGLGGVISICIVITSAVGLYGNEELAPDSLDILASQLHPLLGENASLLLGLGILSAGLTSSITAPLAAAFTVCGLLDKRNDFSGQTFRVTWSVVLLCGMIVSVSDIQPLLVIQYAQFMNGLMLPFIAVLLLFLINTKEMGDHKNNLTQNIISIFFISVVVFLGIRSLISIFS